MNENTISPSNLPETEFIVYFAPGRKCCQCDRWTNSGTGVKGRSDTRAFIVDPQCPEHAYIDVTEETATPEERMQHYATIERFVVWASDEQGTAHVIHPVPAESVPGYDYARHNRDWIAEPKAWEVLYTLNDASKQVHVIYDDVFWRMTLYVDGKWVDR